MTQEQKRVYPWKYAAFRGLAFAVVLSLFSFCTFLAFDIFLSPANSEMSISLNRVLNYFSTIALSYIIIFIFSLILGLFVFVRLLRTRVTYLFIMTQAVILWFLLFIYSMLPVAPIIISNPIDFPWGDVFLNWNFALWQFNSLIAWVIPTSLTFWLLRAIRLI